MKQKFFLLALLVMIIVLTAASKVNSKTNVSNRPQITNAVDIAFPNWEYRYRPKEPVKTAEEIIDKDNIEDLNREIESVDENNHLYESDAITLILDTERDATGNALRRHVYLYQGGWFDIDGNNYYDDRQKATRLSFPADEAGLAQWRKQLVRLFASKNEQLLSEIEIIKEKWIKGKIKDEEYNRLVYEARMRQAQDLSANRPIVIIKPMGNAESGDVIDAFNVMRLCEISTYIPEDITHADSVMVFNSLYPGKDMPSDVNFYTYGNIGNYPQEFDFALDVPKGYEDITTAFITSDSGPMRFINDPLYIPVLSMEVAPSKNIKDGATVALTLHEELFNNDLKSKYIEKSRKRSIKRLLASQSFKQLVMRFGENVAKTEWFEIGSNDASKSNDFQNSVRKIEETIIMGGKLEEYALRRNELLIHTNCHTPYSALKCVIDNLRQIDMMFYILAY